MNIKFAAAAEQKVFFTNAACPYNSLSLTYQKYTCWTCKYTCCPIETTVVNLDKFLWNPSHHSYISQRLLPFSVELTWGSMCFLWQSSWSSLSEFFTIRWPVCSFFPSWFLKAMMNFHYSFKTDFQEFQWCPWVGPPCGTPTTSVGLCGNTVKLGGASSVEFVTTVELARNDGVCY